MPRDRQDISLRGWIDPTHWEPGGVDLFSFQGKAWSVMGHFFFVEV